MKKIMAARPRTGRNTYPHSVSLTLEQIAWIERFPNASELLRKLIDGMREIQGEVEPKLSLLALKHEMDILENQLGKLDAEKWEWVNKRRDWKTSKHGWEVMYDKDMDDPNNFFSTKYPTQIPEGAYYRQQLKAYDTAIEGVRAKLKELKDRFMKES